MKPHELMVGEKVEKIKGYKWPGVVVAIFKTTSVSVAIFLLFHFTLQLAEQNLADVL